MSNAPDPADDFGRGSTPVPPRGGKSRSGSRGGPRPAAGRPGSGSGTRGASGRQARQAAQRRNRLYAIAAVVVVVAIVAVVVIFSVSSSGGSKPRQPAPAAAVTQMENVPIATMVAAVTKVNPQNLNYANPAAGGTLTSAGKPEVLFIGAEFCPICAAERWPMTLALMKFGKFTNLQQTHSAVSDGNAGTWSYYGSTYSSPYLTFDPQEVYTNQRAGNGYKQLQTPTTQAQKVWSANQGSNESFPFIDLGGTATIQSAQFNPQLIYYQKFDYILGAVGDNTSNIGAQIDASAAVFVKYLCNMTHNQGPPGVCSAVAGVQAPINSTNTGQTTPGG